ncbi:NADP-dependent phosphogluconate dehydrogenase [Pseudoflavitalea sp. G-6-1-2]|uniref:NADP-dependent phosphogluconate dehydrogenase n=1 Tax=Pseudoflavitalea sp. G-6-1-2 TaxID=2728841 RepID=UPI00146E61DE|nr:NADP-dependent phosphogluconate dehydrogenase [Pseudoflavitalea sp. G-6-1-2]NML19832.1 NADP-dependent phosphogluconate dehydrogenase [Pseudoflavitalea sp. G-6-1-2]
MAVKQFDFGMIGLGVMGRNLLLNMADHGFKVIGFDLDEQKTSAFEQAATPGTTVKGVGNLKNMTEELSLPRRIMMLVPAGKPVDDVIESLLPLVEPGDIIIDGGNSHYTDTLRRVQYLAAKGIHFMGVGVSGGEQGARTGPSIMPGGDEVAYPHVQPMLEAISAKFKGEPCVAHLGKGAAGHYVKMVHNGIEYAIMQMLSESYDLLHRGAGLSNDELHQVFDQWNKGDLQSFLVEITAAIFTQPDEKTGNRLIDMILDKAGAKGTGKWTSQDALDIGVPIPVIDMAVTMRNISALKAERTNAAALYANKVSPVTTDKATFVQQVHDALYFGILISYAQGLSMLHRASTELDMQIPLPKVVRVWRGGCIIRSTMLDVFSGIYDQNPQLENLLLDKQIASMLQNTEAGMRAVAAAAVQNRFAAGCLLNALTYFDAYSSQQLPTNLIQAQRDFFGAHTYQRIDEPGSFHTEWKNS